MVACVDHQLTEMLHILLVTDKPLRSLTHPPFRMTLLASFNWNPPPINRTGSDFPRKPPSIAFIWNAAEYARTRTVN